MNRYLIPHKQCEECPFRNDCLRGYFGPYSAQHYLQGVLSEGQVQCHMTTGTPEPRHCTGAALFRSRICKEPRGAEQRQHQEACVRKYGTEGIFTYPEFRLHHLMDKEKS